VSTPLEGLRVVDLSETLPGALAAMVLADLGADVVMVERPGGSRVRALPGAAILARGKRSVVADWHQPVGRDEIRRLVAGADVLVESFRPGVTAALELDHERLASANPRLVHLSITGWGTGHADAGRKGYEHLVLAKLGFLEEFARVAPRPGPAYVSLPFGSIGAALTGLQGVLAALVERERSGLGQLVETNLVEGVASLDVWAWWFEILGQRYPDAFQRMPLFTDDDRPAGFFAFQNLLAPTADGHWLLFGMNMPHMLRAGLREMGLESMLEDPAYASFPQVDDDDKRHEAWVAMVEAVRRKTRAEWEAIFARDPDLFGEEARPGPAVLDHPQFRHSDMSVQVDDPVQGPMRQPGPMVRRHGEPVTSFRPAPAPGEHGDAVSWPAAAPSSRAGAASTATADAPLAGVTVLELGALFAGPYAGTLLAELGARVIKVEPIEGDPIRGMLGFPELGGAKVMQGKESIAVDAGTDEGREIVRRLAERADVVLQSYRPDAAARMGVDAAGIAAVNPRALHVSAMSYGVDGPMANKPAFATTIGAAVGHARVNGGRIPPVDASTPIEEVCSLSIRLSTAGTQMNVQSDGISALGAAVAVLVGHLAKVRGREVPPLVTTMLGTSVFAIVDHLTAETTAATPDPDLLGVGPLYRLYRAADGWIFLAAPEEKEWTALGAALASHVDLAGDTRFADPGGRTRHADALAEVLAGVFAQQPAAHWEEHLTAADVGCVAVDDRTPEYHLMSDELGRAWGLVVDVVHPTFDEVPRLRPPVQFSRSTTVARPGVLNGQHTDAILGELGYDEAAIADLRTRSIVA